MKKLLTWVTTLCILFSVVFIQTNDSAVFADQINKEQKLTMILNTRQLYHNGAVYLSNSPHVVYKGVTYISMRALGDRLGYKISYNSASKKSEMSNGNNRLAISQNGSSYDFNGKAYAYKNDAAPYVIKGTLMVPLRDLVSMLGIKVIPKIKENKVELIWTEKIEKPEVQALFETNKIHYKIGEPITYYDQSFASHSSIIDRMWTNNETAFFEPGPQTIYLEVKNDRGQQSITSQTIMIKDEVMYTKEVFNALNTPIGHKMPIDREGVLNHPVIPFQLNHQPFTLVRSNSPEQINEEGIYYNDTLVGNSRFIIHHQNARPTPVKIYLVATNKGSSPATVTVNNLGFSSPSKYVSSAGKDSIANYLKSIQRPVAEDQMTIKPDMTEIIIKELSNQPIPTGSIVTLYADIHSNETLQYRVIVLDESSDFNRTVPYLTGINAARDGTHIRGTFQGGNRQLTVPQLVGEQKGRIVIGDGVEDPFVTGKDVLSGFNEINYGNYGVSYTLLLNKVAPNTAIVLNPRGGHYAGAFLVNGQLVMGPETGYIHNPNEAVVLYRTGQGDTTEEVKIEFIPAAGSNLPINLITIPLKEVE